MKGKTLQVGTITSIVGKKQTVQETMKKLAVKAWQREKEDASKKSVNEEAVKAETLPLPAVGEVEGKVEERGEDTIKGTTARRARDTREETNNE